MRRAEHAPHPLTLGVTPACAGRPLSTFFRHGASPADLRALCGACPLYEACDAYAMAYDVRGIWAGTTYSEGAQRRHRLGILPLSVFTDTPRDLDVLRERRPYGGDLRARRRALAAQGVSTR
ncbi:WhiB family transcriptional regulator [Microbispora sp. CA-102843]|uniref:WhiB family transcriptional regulator n=1 Tax=Microbispora sp. CA-102843 TaxID=3239952 RepID=UPI003D8FE53F